MEIKSYSDEEKNRILTCCLIVTDASCIKSILQTNNDPIITLGFLPFCAMFCYESESFLKDIKMDISVPKEKIYSLMDMRLRLKLFNEKRYKRTKEMILGIDQQEDSKYRDLVLLGFMKKRNLYYNTGIFFDESKHIIGNTQYFSSLFQDKKFTKDISKKEVLEYGKLMGQIINGIQNIFEININVEQPANRRINIMYKDINTNTDSIINIADEDKEIDLLLLDIIGNINYALYIAEKIIPQQSLLFRFQYISMYYAMAQLKTIKNKCRSRQLQNIIDNCFQLTADISNSQFRGCLMHYSLMHNNYFEIKDEYLSLELPLFGLVESYFDGHSLDYLHKTVKNNLFILSNTLPLILHDTLSIGLKEFK